MARPLFSALAFFVAVMAVGCTNRRPAPPADPGAPIVTVSKPVVKTIDQYTELTGTLAAAKTVELRSRVTGRILEVKFAEGKDVKKGDVLILIDPKPFEVALEKATADVANAKAKLEGAKSTEKRVTEAKGGAVSQDEKDQAIANRKVADANVAMAEASVKDAELNLSYTKVTAPFDGLIDRILKDEGNDVTGGTGQGTVLTTIVSIDPISAYFDVDEATVLMYRKLIAQGVVKSARETEMAVEIQLKDEQGYPHKGVLDFLSNRLSPTTGSLQIRGSFPNPHGGKDAPALIPGYFVRGRVPRSKLENAILIPDSAVNSDQAGKVVYTVDAENRVVGKPVVLGGMADGLRIIESGLVATDRVILRGIQRVTVGMVVDPRDGPISVLPAKK